MLLASGSFLSQMMLLAGMVLLAWILVRRNIKMRKRNRKANREIRELEKATDTRSSPLADAPKEVLRWQAAMFDLQRELKAELDTKILVVQSLLREADRKIAKLESASDLPPSLPSIGATQHDVQQLSSSGHCATEIAEKLGLPLADVELSLSLRPLDASSSESL